MQPARASSRQRERSVRALATAYESGQLSTGTFELRVGEALAGRSVLDLRRLIEDVSLLGRLRQMFSPRDPAAEIVLPSGPCWSMTIGRDPRCRVVFDEPTVSRFHALLRRKDN